MSRKTLLAALLLLVLGGSLAAQDIAANVFEVVVEKPKSDPLSYQEALPLDLLPFMERNDPCYSIGTAFALDQGRFVTAAHVLSPDQSSLNGAYGLRDNQGRIHPIGRVLAYSNRRDFVVFDVPGLAAPGLPVASSYKLNTPVRTVGNAYGEGIVIRDGTLTSATPEDRDGEWRWLRFSAAASPGNSGGPLIDAEGKVVGIVTMKSQNENLNYALPVQEMDLAAQAVFDRRYRYVLPNIVQDESGQDRFTLELPMDFTRFRQELSARAQDLEIEAGRKLAAREPENRFPQAETSRSLIDSTWYSALPQLISQKTDGSWYLRSPDKTERGTVDKTGSFEYGSIGSYTLFNLRKPKDHPLADLFASDQKLMDAVLKGYGLSRTIGGKAIRITSLGPSRTSRWQADRWGRQWLVATWAVAFANMREIMAFLPVPSGAVGMLIRCPESDANAILFDLGFQLDFIHATHLGTLADWREYLALGERLPEVLKEWRVSGLPGSAVTIHSGRFDLRIDPKVMEWKENGLIYAMSSFMRQGSGFVWDINRLFCVGDVDGEGYVDLARRVKPDAADSDSSRADWQKVIGEAYPYNASPFVNKSQKQVRGTVFPTPDGSVATDPSLAWTLTLADEADTSDQAIRDGLVALRNTVRLAPGELVSPPGQKASLLKPVVLDQIDGKTIFAAAEAGDKELAAAFIDRKSRLDARNPESRTPLAVAIRNGHEELALQLLAAGAPASSVDQFGQTPLHLAASAGSARLVKTLLERKPALEASDYLGETPLLASLEAGSAECAALLLAAGAKPSTLDQSRRGSLALALAHGLESLAPDLLAKGASPAAADEDGWTPLMYALRYASDATVDTLLKLAPPATATTNQGWTALHVAARHGRLANLQSLLAAGIGVNLQTAAGRSALMLAVEGGFPEAAAWLLAHGADRGLRDKQGLRAADIADAGKNQALIGLFKE